MKKLLLFMLVLFQFNLAYGVERTFQWDQVTHDIELNEVDPNTVQYRLFQKLASETDYNYTLPLWDSVVATDPHAITVRVDLDESEDYDYVIRAYNTAGESDDSNQVANPPIRSMVVAFALAEKYESPVYFGTTDQLISLTWEFLGGGTALIYEHRLWDTNKKAYVLNGTSTTTDISVMLPATGVYEVEVRAGYDSGKFGPWKKLDARLVGWIGGVGPIIIGN